jgi:hypothetical protein
MPTAESIVDTLLPLVRRFAVGRYGIALGGAHAKETGDALSDVDIYLFAERALPNEERSAMTREMCGEACGVASWGDPEVEGGTDFRHDGQVVEVWFREIGSVADAVARCRAGEIRREYRAWTVMGFFGHAVLSDLKSMRIVDDPSGILAGWQAEVAEYPPALRREIVGRFLAEARFWPDNVHYRTAVERRDLVYAGGIVRHAAHALVQAAFALNHAYFPGEKKLARALDLLPDAPAGFGARVEALLYPGTPADADLEAQSRELAALVADVEARARAAGILAE